MNIKELNEKYKKLKEDLEVYGDELVSIEYKKTDVANFYIVSWGEDGQWVARANVDGNSIEGYGASLEELVEDIKNKMIKQEYEIINTSVY